MKRIFLVSILLLGLFASYSLAHMVGQGMMEGQGQQQLPAESPYGGWYPPCQGMMGGGMMGPGMMGHGMMMGGQGMMGGGMMGPGMMGGQGGMMGPGMQQQQPQQQPQYQQPQKPLEEKDARTILENYLKTIRNPNLKLGKVKDLDYAFEAEIVTKENSLVDKIIIDKKTGWMRSAY